MKIVVIGAHAIGRHLARLLSRSSEEITLVDPDPERLERIGRDYDLLTLQGDPASVKTLREAGADKADLFIAVSTDQCLNICACVTAHALGARKTVAQVDSEEYTNEEVATFYRKLGVDNLIYPEMLAARDIINGLKMSWVRQRWDVHGGALVMLGIKLRETCQILNRPLRELCGPDDPYHVVAIKRHADTIIPGGNDELRLYDMAYFMTTRQYIPYIRKIVGKEHYVDVKDVMVMGGGVTAVKAVSAMPSWMTPKIIERDQQRCEELNQELTGGQLVIHGDGRDVSLLVEENVRSMQAFVALTGNAETNILACLTAKRMGVRKTVAEVENMDYATMAESLDIGTIINKKAIAASSIYQLMLDADVMNVTFLLTANADLAEFIPKEGAKVTRCPVKDLGLPRGMTIGGLVRGGQGMLVSGGTQIQAGDSVVVFCHGVPMKKIEKLFQ